MVSRPCVHSLNMFECRYIAEDGRSAYVHKMHEKRINTHFQAGGKKDKSYFELMTMEISPSTATGGAKNYF